MREMQPYFSGSEHAYTQWVEIINEACTKLEPRKSNTSAMGPPYS